jgi:hypothetical protein
VEQGDPADPCTLEAQRLVAAWRYEPARWAGPPSVPWETPECVFLPGDAIAVYTVATLLAPRTPVPANRRVAPPG